MSLSYSRLASFRTPKFDQGNVESPERIWPPPVGVGSCRRTTLQRASIKGLIAFTNYKDENEQQVSSRSSTTIRLSSRCRQNRQRILARSRDNLGPILSTHNRRMGFLESETRPGLRLKSLICSHSDRASARSQRLALKSRRTVLTVSTSSDLLKSR